MIKRLFILFQFVIFYQHIHATHIVGGEIFYKCLGGNNYGITLKLYRDCFNGQAPFDDTARVGVFNNGGSLLQTLGVPFPGSHVLPITLNSAYYTAPTDVCVEEAIYTYTVSLPPLAGGYSLSYQRCCRNNSILNLNTPGNQGATYTTKIPNPPVANCNSSPHYKNFPPIFLCNNVPFSFDHSAVDDDAGDSLAYDLFAPFSGASALNPMPNPPSAPPYPFVSFTPPYSGTNPMSSFPAMAIDVHTGLITGTPNMLGQWVVGVRVREYRNGVLLGENKRDFQFNVTDCPNVVVSSIPSQQKFCFGFQANFSNNSVNAQSYRWDFGVSAVLNDTSNAATPTYTYPGAGTYTVSLIANPNLPCADTAESVLKIDPLLQPVFIPPPDECLIGNSFDYTAAGSFVGAPTSTFSWNFGPSALPKTSTSQNPSGVLYTTSGVFTNSLTISENGCVKTYTNVVVVSPTPTVSVFPANVTLCTGHSTSLTASGANTYSWLPTTGINPANAAVVVAAPVVSGTYTVTGLNATGCSDDANVFFTVLATPTLSCSDASICVGSSIQLTASGANSYNWSPSSGLNQSNSPNVIASPTATTVYKIMGGAVNGCADSINVSVKVNALPTVEVGPDIDMCSGFSAPLNATGALTYVWNPISALSASTGSSVITNALVNTTYIVTGMDVNGCFDADDIMVGVNDSLFANAGPNVSICAGTTSPLFGSGGVYYSWSPGIGLNNATIHNPIANPPTSITYTLTVFGGFCPTFVDSVNIHVDQLATLSVLPQNITVCEGKAITFSVSAGGANYFQWSPAAGLSCNTCQNPVATPTTSSNYFLQASIVPGCTSFDTVRMTVVPSPIPNFTIVAGDCDVQFINSSIGATSYLWDFGDGDSTNTSQTPLHAFTKPGTYTITLKVGNADGCSDFFSFPFQTDGIEHGYTVPNVFTPNGDEENDEFKIQFTNMTNISCKIYNKWGTLVYELFLPNQVWDGRLYNGFETPEGVYFYLLKMKGKCDGTPYEKKGFITLFR